MVWAWNLVCGRFMNFQNGRKFSTLLTFGCPSNHTCGCFRLPSSRRAAGLWKIDLLCYKCSLNAWWAPCFEKQMECDDLCRSVTNFLKKTLQSDTQFKLKNRAWSCIANFDLIWVRDGAERKFVPSAHTASGVSVLCSHRNHICCTYPCPRLPPCPALPHVLSFTSQQQLPFVPHNLKHCSPPKIFL